MAATGTNRLLHEGRTMCGLLYLGRPIHWLGHEAPPLSDSCNQAHTSARVANQPRRPGSVNMRIGKRPARRALASASVEG